MNLLRQHPELFATIVLALALLGVGGVLWRLRRRLLSSEQERRRAAERSQMVRMRSDRVEDRNDVDEAMREAGRIVRRVIDAMKEQVRPGVPDLGH